MTENINETNILDGVAIIGMAGRFPGADNIDTFWKNLLEGKESITFFTKEGLSPQVSDEERNSPSYVPARGTLGGIDLFDADFFGISPLEAKIMDPQQRLFLELCWEALENAGYDADLFPGLIGVYGGMNNNGYYLHNVLRQPDAVKRIGPFLTMLANSKDFLTTRVSYKLNLKGPSETINTACSTSLVTIVKAFQALMTYQCDMALAGGVSITVPQNSGYLFQDGGMLSPDGHTRPFDEDSQGTTFNNGAGLVVLKRYDEAIENNDNIIAVIRGTGLNNDGSDKVSFTAPSVNGQKEAVRMALDQADISPETISYVETHGTATPMGDPIEVSALTQAFAVAPELEKTCLLGSVKSNVGHLIHAAGVAGLIKTSLALHNKVIPPTINHHVPTTNIDWEKNPFTICNKLTEWLYPNGPRRAGVSAFGVGGTNAHVILEEHEPHLADSSSLPFHLFPFSARSPSALQQQIINLHEHLGTNNLEPADIAFTLQNGRKHFNHRSFGVFQTQKEAMQAFASPETPLIFSAQTTQRNPEIVFMIPGQGAQHPNMAKGLYVFNARFREIIDYGAKILLPELGLDLRSILFSNNPSDAELLKQTRITQPALYLIQYGLAMLWKELGIQPSAMIGHSIGELTAACLAGVFSFEEGLLLVAQRGKLMQQCPPGSMLSVRLPATEAAKRLTDGLVLSVINSSQLCVIGGPTDKITLLYEVLNKEDIPCQILQTSHAFHSPAMETAAKEFITAIEHVTLHSPSIPFISCVTGTWITPDQAGSSAYWGEQILSAVQYSKGISQVLKDEDKIFLEVGPRTTAATLARQHLEGRKRIIISPFDKAPSDQQDYFSFLIACGQLWLNGLELTWPAIYAQEQRSRIPLPTYPFEKKYCWLEPETSAIKEPYQNENQTIGENVKPELATNNIQQLIINKLAEIILESSGFEIDSTSPDNTFLEVGLDSLSLTQLATVISNEFQVKVTFRQLLENLATPTRLAEHIATNADSSRLPKPEQEISPPPLLSESHKTEIPYHSQVPLSEPGSQATSLQTILSQQLQIIERQLEIISAPAPPSPTSPLLPQKECATNSSPKLPPPPTESSSQKAFGPAAKINTDTDNTLTNEQQEFLESLISSYTTKTKGSKEFAQKNRRHMADPRTVSGFRPLFKEMIYQLVVSKSSGCNLWDIDGNEYVDMLNGFGSNFLGYGPSYVSKAVTEQIQCGIEIGPQHPLTEDVASLMAEFTGLDRFAFCNTGSEAVLGCMRIARTVTGKKTIVIFRDAYHGIFDEVIVRGTPSLKSFAAAPGINNEAVKNTLILEYGTEESLAIIKERSTEIAGILVEPVQSRNPALQPKNFIHQLREIATETGAALIIDEVITGFRIHPRGSQGYFNVEADLATYGKVIGGGLPIGIIGGKTRFMDALDGGHWQFGDDSYPEVGVTYFAGTFVRHPMALASCKAVLQHLKEQGGQLQETVNQKADSFCHALNDIFATANAPLVVDNFGSLMKIQFEQESPYNELLYFLLREKGVHIWDARPIFLTTAHTNDHTDRVLRAFSESIDQLQSVGFLTRYSSSENTIQEVTNTPALCSASHVDSGIATSRNARENCTSITSNNNDRFPMSRAQREMWLGAQMHMEASGPHHACTGLYFYGPVNLSVMRRAIVAVVQRHDGLKCRFDEDGYDVLVNSSFKPNIRLHDLSNLQRTRQDECVNDMLHRESRRLMDLTHGPLVDFQIVKLSDQRFLLLFTAQMIVCDGWSHYVVFEELSTLYNAFCNNEEPKLKPAIQMRKYVHWELHEGEVESKESEDFWLAQFTSVPPPIDLPTRIPRPPARSFEGDRQVLTMSPVLLKEIKNLGKTSNSSYFAILLAAFQVWIHRLSGAQNFVIGVPFAAQGQLGMDTLINQCVNVLPIRAIIESDTSFSTLLKEAWSSLLDAHERWNFSFGSLIAQLDLPPDSSRIPLVNVLFNIDPPMSNVKFDGIEHRFFTGPRSYYQYDLGFNLVEDQDTIKVECDYNSNLFDGDMISTWIKSYELLLQGIVSDIKCPIHKLPMVKTSLAQTPVSKQSTNKDHNLNTHSTLDELISVQAKRNPDATAIESNESQLSYGELETQAEELAHKLRQTGITNGDVIGIYLKRSLELPVVLLAVLKVGATYIPIDTVSPHSLLTVLASEDILDYCIAEDSTAPQLQSSGIKPLNIEEIQTGTTSTITKKQSLTKTIDQNDIAYVVYSSGSSTKPKGVMVSHRAIVNQLLAIQEKPGFDNQDIMLACSHLSSCGSALELWLPLSVGARVIIVPCSIPHEPSTLESVIKKHNISVMQSTPSTWHRLIQNGWKGSTHLRIWSGGEPLRSNLAEMLLPLCNELWNLYGSTETGTLVMASKIETGKTITLGEPIGKTSVMVADRMLQPLPAGIPGELLVTGEDLSQGYPVQVEKTEKINTYEYLPEDGRVNIFRSGDLAKVTHDGKILLQGRLASQIEINGFPINLTDIETTLEKHESVQQAAVTTHEITPGRKLLVGYVTLKNPESGTENLYHHLQEQVAEYMIPAQLITLDKFPLTSANTIDFKKLPVPNENSIDPEKHRRNRKATLILPRTATEKTLAEIWSQVLKIQHLSVLDNFFDLGGQSMLAMKVILQANKNGLALKPRSIFLHPTIAELAEVVDMNAADYTPRAKKEVSPTGEVPLTPAQLRFLHERGTVNPNHWNFSVLVDAYQLDSTAIEKSLGGLLAQHDALRLRMATHNNTWSQYIADITDNTPFKSYYIGDLSTVDKVHRIETICNEMQNSLNLTNGPVIQVAHFDCGSEDHDRLFFTMHHFVMDVFSWEIFWEDFEASYNQLLTGQNFNIPPKTDSFRDWSLQLRKLAQTAEVQSAAPRWLELPWKQIGHLPLDFDVSRRANTNYSTDDLDLLINVEESRYIVSPNGNHRPEEVILVALAQALAEWTASSTVMIEGLNHGRSIVEDTDLSRTVGFMLSYQPVILQMPKESPLETILSDTIKQLRQLPEGFTFDLLRYFGGKKKILHAFEKLPRAEVLFNLTWDLEDAEDEVPSLFSPCKDACGSDYFPKNGRYYPLAISAAIVSNGLRFKFAYSKNLHKQSSIEKLSNSFCKNLLKINNLTRNGNHSQNEITIDTLTHPNHDK